MTSRSLRKRLTTASARTTRWTGAKFALVAALFVSGGSLLAQPQPFKGLAAPPGYRQRPQPVAKEQLQPAARPQGTINPKADRAPMAGASGRVMYFHKPANALAPNASDDLVPVEALAVAGPDIVPSVLPEHMSPNDDRLAQAPTPPAPRSVYEFQPPPVASDTPISLPAAARAEEPTPALLPAPTPVPVPMTMPVSARPPIPVPEPTADLDPGLVRTSQKKQDVPRPMDKTDRVAATRLPARDKIFVIYDDAQLESAIIASVKRDVYKMPDGTKRELSMEDDKLWRFPDLARVVPEGTVYQSKTSQYPPRTECFEPAYVVHRRLNFEDKNTERAGWDLGIAQPLVSTFCFYKDVLFWPHNLAAGVHNCWDTSAGKCLPGSPTPFYLYPPEFSLTGSVVETVLVTGTVFIFP